jgi:hypothetical protein
MIVRVLDLKVPIGEDVWLFHGTSEGLDPDGL